MNINEILKIAHTLHAFLGNSLSTIFLLPMPLYCAKWSTALDGNLLSLSCFLLMLLPDLWHTCNYLVEKWSMVASLAFA